MGLKAKDASGEVVAAPTLELVLSYDYQVRKYMSKAMNEGTQMIRALEDRMKDTSTKFLTPATLEAASASKGIPAEVRLRSRSPRRGDESGGGSRNSWNQRSKGDKGRKGGGKGKTKGGKTLHSRTADGRDICYAWNNKDQRCRFNCGRVHCCQICFGNHPAHPCKGKQQKDTDGAAK